MSLESSNPRFVAIAGDLHGDLDFTKKMITLLSSKGVKTVIQVGDFGYWGDDIFINSLNFTIKKLDMMLYFVKGNHEHHHLLETHPIVDGVKPIKSNIIYLPNCYRWEWHGISFLALGGAHSIDRDWITPGGDWFPEEAITYEEVDKVTQDGHADIMICHDVPDGVEIKAIKNNPMGWPAHAIRAADHHREILRAAVDGCTPRTIFSGHYHSREDFLFDGGNYVTGVHILNMNTYPWWENVAVLDLKENRLYDGKELDNIERFE